MAAPRKVAARAPSTEPSPARPTAARWSARTSWALLGVLLALFLFGTLGALRQAPDPDLLRDVAPWDIVRAAWWLHPLERNAFERQVIDGELDAVQVSVDGTQLWAVGRRGLVVHSRDGGRSWRQQRPPPAAAPTPRSLGQGLAPLGEAVAGEPPAKMFKGDYPALNQAVQAPNEAAPPQVSQQLQPTPAAPGALSVAVDLSRDDFADLHAVTFLADGRHGWAVGDDGVVIATDDGGAHWRVQACAGRRAVGRGVRRRRPARLGGGCRWHRVRERGRWCELARRGAARDARGARSRAAGR